VRIIAPLAAGDVVHREPAVEAGLRRSGGESRVSEEDEREDGGSSHRASIEAASIRVKAARS